MSHLSFYHCSCYKNLRSTFISFCLLTVVTIIWHVLPWHAFDSTTSACHVRGLLWVIYLPAWLIMCCLCNQTWRFAVCVLATQNCITKVINLIGNIINISILFVLRHRYAQNIGDGNYVRRSVRRAQCDKNNLSHNLMLHITLIPLAYPLVVKKLTMFDEGRPLQPKTFCL